MAVPQTELALQVPRRALDDKIPPGLVLADRAHGTAREFRSGVREMGLHHAVAVDSRTTVMVFDKLGRRREEIISLIDLAHRIGARSECLGKLVPLGERHLRFAISEFVEHYHLERNHQGLDNRLITAARSTIWHTTGTEIGAV